MDGLGFLELYAAGNERPLVHWPLAPGTELIADDLPEGIRGLRVRIPPMPKDRSDEIETLRIERDVARDRLATFGNHKPMCGANNGISPCDCGFWAAMDWAAKEKADG